MVHEFPGWTNELRSLQPPTLLIFGDRDHAVPQLTLSAVSSMTNDVCFS
jgi:hypothetical protein